MLEHRGERLVSRLEFAKRMAAILGFVVILIFIALFIGIAGYHWLDDLSWIDSLVNASMILGGMGPVDPLKTNAAKAFASFYALFSGLFFIGIMGLLLTPVLHRMIHIFHFKADQR